MPRAAPTKSWSIEMADMKSIDTTDEKDALRAEDRGPKTVESPALAPAGRNHPSNFAAAAKALRACAPNASHWEKVHAAVGIEP